VHLPGDQACCAEADYIAFTCPRNPRYRASGGLCVASTSMKPTGPVGQLRRGGIVDEQAPGEHWRRAPSPGLPLNVYSNDPGSRFPPAQVRERLILYAPPSELPHTA